MKTTRIILLAVVVFAIIAIGTVLLSTITQPRRTIATRGRVKKLGIEVYWDAEGTNITNYIDWGNMTPGDTVTMQLYCQNIGNENATLWLNSSAWIPMEAKQFFTLFWDYDNQTVQEQEIIPVALSLTVSKEVQGIKDFYFDIVIGVSE